MSTKNRWLVFICKNLYLRHTKAKYSYLSVAEKGTSDQCSTYQVIFMYKMTCAWHDLSDQQSGIVTLHLERGTKNLNNFLISMEKDKCHGKGYISLSTNFLKCKKSDLHWQKHENKTLMHAFCFVIDAGYLCPPWFYYKMFTISTFKDFIELQSFINMFGIYKTRVLLNAKKKKTTYNIAGFG